jgi:hypothetical protein
MAHTCPQCGCYCTCKGDWDDIDLGHEPAGGCVHYLDPDCDCNHDGEEDYESDYGAPETVGAFTLPRN